MTTNNDCSRHLSTRIHSEKGRITLDFTYVPFGPSGISRALSGNVPYRRANLTFVMMGSRVRVTQAAPNFLSKTKGLDPTIRAVELETSLFAKRLSPRCLQKNGGCRIRMANCGSAPGLDAPRQHTACDTPYPSH
jgi:hypothetical protein